jgi:hypothetical protein
MWKDMFSQWIPQPKKQTAYNWQQHLSTAATYDSHSMITSSAAQHGSLAFCCCAELHACRNCCNNCPAKGYRRPPLPETAKQRPTTLMALPNPSRRGSSSSRRTTEDALLEGFHTSRLAAVERCFCQVYAVQCDVEVRAPTGLRAKLPSAQELGLFFSVCKFLIGLLF